MRSIKHTSLTHAQLLAEIRYSPDNGIMYRRVNSRWVVTGFVRPGGAIQVDVGGHTFPAAELTWFYVHGVWSTESVRHLNGVRYDNRITNLVECPDSEIDPDGDFDPRGATAAFAFRKEAQAQVDADYRLLRPA